MPKTNININEIEKEPQKITSFPGEAVDQHLKRYGHLPGDGDCCTEEAYALGREEALKEVEEAVNGLIVEYRSKLKGAGGTKDEEFTLGRISGAQVSEFVIRALRTEGREI